VFQKLGDFRAATAAVSQVNLALYPLAFLVYGLTFPVRGWRWRHLLTKARIPLATSAGTVAAERMIDTLVVFLTFTAVGLHIFRGRLPAEARLLMAAGLGLVATIALVLVTMRRPSRVIVTRLLVPPSGAALAMLR
jgi:hypothetical protein